MHNKRWLLVLILQVLPLSWAADAVGNAVAVLGTVSVVRAEDGRVEALQPNGEVYLNDVVQTGADGLAKLLLRDESILKVSPNSELAISDMIAGPGEGGRSTVDLLKGRIRSVIGNKLGANREFNVNTPVAVAGVRGTDFEVVHVLVDGQWVTGVRTFDGAVSFTAQGLLAQTSGIVVLPNQYSLATETAPPSPPKAINSSQLLLEILGVEAPTSNEQNLDLPNDERLDIEQVQALLLKLDTSVDLNIQTLITRVTTASELNKTTDNGRDVQLDVITEPLDNGAKLNFEIDIPLPN